MGEKNIATYNGKVMISNEFYRNYRGQGPLDYNVDVFSIIGALSNNADIFLETDEKKRYKAMLRYMYSQNEIQEIIAKNNVKNLDALIALIQKTQGLANVPSSLKPVMDSLILMQEYVAAVSEDKDLSNTLTPPGRQHSEKLRLLKSGALGLVNNILHLNDGNDLSRLTTRVIGIGPLLIDENKTPKPKMQVAYDATIKHIKNVYGYSVKATMAKEPEHIKGKTLICDLKNDLLTNSVNMMYNVSKQLTGSKNISFDIAKKYFSEKNDSKELEQKFNEKKAVISEAVTILSTMFMSRFVYSSDVYFEVNRQLSMQLAYKMKGLVFSNDGENENDPSVQDVWLIKYIKDRVSRNVTEILTKNGIHTAQQLSSIYSLNGSVVNLPNDIVTIDDFVFAKQTNFPTKQRKQELVNSIENKTGAIIKDDNISRTIKRIKNPVVRNLLKNPTYRKIYKEEYRKTYEDFMKTVSTETATDEGDPSRLKVAASSIQEPQDKTDNLQNTSPEELVTVQAQQDAKQDVLEDLGLSETPQGQNLVADGTKLNVAPEGQNPTDDSTTDVVDTNDGQQPETDAPSDAENNTPEVPSETDAPSDAPEAPSETGTTGEEQVGEKPVADEPKVDTEPESTGTDKNVGPVEPRHRVLKVVDTRSKMIILNSLLREPKQYSTEQKPKAPEEMYEAIKKSYISLLNSKNVKELLNLRSIDTQRIQTDKQNIAGRKVKDHMIEEIATALAERTCVYYAKAYQSKNVSISDRPRAIISCFCNEVLMGKTIFASNWRKSVDPLLAVLLADECNTALKEIDLEYAVDEDTYAKVNKKYATQIANFKGELEKFRKKQAKLQDESSEENV